MIKINLSHNKKSAPLSGLGGIDFTHLKYKPLLLIIGLIYLPDFVLIPQWAEEREALSSDVNSKQTKLGSLKRRISQSKDDEKKILGLQVQEDSLGKKLIAVKQAISERRNPYALLLYLAKNMPSELWIKELTVNQNEMLIKGEALNYASIGNFVNSLRSSVFISDANLTSTTTDKRKIESFEVKFGIARFDQ